MTDWNQKPKPDPVHDQMNNPTAALRIAVKEIHNNQRSTTPGVNMLYRVLSSVKLICVAMAVLAIGGSAYALQSDKVSYVTGSSQKVCQLTGETDLERGQPTPNRTETNFGLKGADLGSSFEHNGKVYFLFGDTFPKTYGARPDALDSIAYSSDTNPEDCVALTFLTDPDGVYRPPVVSAASYPSGTSPIGQYGCQVPVHGFSANGKMYVFFSDLNQCNATTNSLERSILASSTNDGQTFQYVCEVSTSKFINISVVIVNNADVPGLPQTSGQGVLLWGAGPYRKSSPCLAFLPLNTVTNRITWRYFAGLDSLGQPMWSSNEQDSANLFSCYCIGELSVTWNPFLGKWLMLYNCDDPRGINFRAADQPWGSWPPTAVLFDPWADGGYCHFMHVDWDYQNCDSVYDSMFGRSREREWGGEYGPYVISRYVTGDATHTMIYFAMSTWNPYEAVLMKSTLAMARSPTAFEN